MGVRFWRRVKIAPGVTLNLSKKSASMSFGPRGAKFTVGPHGKRTTIGATGTGLFYTNVHSKKKGTKTPSSSSSPSSSTSQATHPDTLNLGFFQKLSTSEEEKALVDGLREISCGNEGAALKHLEQATNLADAAYLAAVISLNNNQLDDSEKYFLMAEQKHQQLGTYFDKYEVSAIMSLPITREVYVKVDPNLRGVLLGLAEVYQAQGAWQDAARCLQRLRKSDPDDVAVKLSLAELLMEAHPDSKSVSQSVVEIATEMENETEADTALMLYKGKALRQLGLATAARDTLTAALRRKKGRSNELLRYLRYERVLVYDDLGQKTRVRSELEKLYAEDPNFEDVAEKLGL